MPFRYTPYMTRFFCWKNLYYATGETSQGKIRTNSERSSNVETLSIIPAAQKFFRDRTVRLPAAHNQMNVPCKQLRSKKVP